MSASETKEPEAQIDSRAELRAINAQLDQVMKPLASDTKPERMDLRKAKNQGSPSSRGEWKEEAAPNNKGQIEMLFNEDSMHKNLKFSDTDDVAMDMGQGLIDRKFNKELQADEVFESDDYRSLKMMAKEFENQQNEKHLMELMEAKGTPRSGSTAELQKAAPNKDSFDLFKQSPRVAGRASIVEDVKAGDDDGILAPNYSQKKLVDKLKAMGN